MHKNSLFDITKEENRATLIIYWTITFVKGPIGQTTHSRRTDTVRRQSTQQQRKSCTGWKREDVCSCVWGSSVWSSPWKLAVLYVQLLFGILFRDIRVNVCTGPERGPRSPAAAAPGLVAHRPHSRACLSVLRLERWVRLRQVGSSGGLAGGVAGAAGAGGAGGAVLLHLPLPPLRILLTYEHILVSSTGLNPLM